MKRLALETLTSRLEETDLSRGELSETLGEIACALSRRIEKERLVAQSKRIEKEQGDIGDDCTDKVCQILKISKSEFGQIMNLEEKGNR